VPEICRFNGVVIAMFYREHGVAHFHAAFAGERASIDIETGSVRGNLPPATLRTVLEWAGVRRAELFENWERARRNEPLKPVPPLD
jgi:hypothetical protein